jgi:hypothetical protein
VSLDSAAHPVIAAAIHGAVDAGGGVRGTSGPGVLVARLTAGGVHEWSRVIAGPSSGIAPRPVVRSERLDLAFSVSGPIDFGSGTAIAGGPVGLTYLDPMTGSYLGAARIGVDGRTTVFAESGTTSGRCAVGYQVARDFGTAAAGGYLACVDDALATTDAESWGTTTFSAATPISDDGRVYLVGTNTGSTPLFWGESSVSSMAQFMAATENSAPLWARALPSELPAGSVIAARAHTLVVVGAGATRTFDVGDGSHTGSIAFAVFGI